MRYLTPERLERIALLHFQTAYCNGLRPAEQAWNDANPEFREAVRRQVESVLLAAEKVKRVREKVDRPRLQMTAGPDELRW